jgi:hypothetical protein
MRRCRHFGGCLIILVSQTVTDEVKGESHLVEMLNGFLALDWIDDSDGNDALVVCNPSNLVCKCYPDVADSPPHSAPPRADYLTTFR